MSGPSVPKPQSRASASSPPAWRRWLVLALALALSIATILVLLSRGLRPLATLTHGANDLADGNYSRRIPRQGSPELLSLIDVGATMFPLVEPRPAP